MIKSNELIDEINNILKIHYPIKKSFNDINQLSHFNIFYIVKDNYYFPFNININGTLIFILNGKYKSNKIIKVLTTKYFTWKNYIKLYLSFQNITYNPYITDNMLYYINRESIIDILHINNIIIDDQKQSNIIINYINHGPQNHIQLSIKKINKDNHFYFSSFSINGNKDEIKTEMLRLFENRDKYKSIHFHLDNNGGGDIVPAHLILKCLVGKKEKWMKNIKKILTNKEIFEWNCWQEDKKGINNFDCVQMLNLGDIPSYFEKYEGKIHLYMNPNNGSAAWFFITYLIYAFASNIERYSEKHYGQILKFGTISKNSQLILHGKSGTTSGDGNTISIKFKEVKIICPTQQFISSSIKIKDFNRFWIA